MVSEAFTSTYMATKKERKKRTPQERVSSSLVESSVSGPTFGRVSALCLKERMVTTEQMIMIRIERRNMAWSTVSLLDILGTRQLLITNFLCLIY